MNRPPAAEQPAVHVLAAEVLDAGGFETTGEWEVVVEDLVDELTATFRWRPIPWLRSAILSRADDEGVSATRVVREALRTGVWLAVSDDDPTRALEDRAMALVRTARRRAEEDFRGTPASGRRTEIDPSELTETLSVPADGTRHLEAAQGVEDLLEAATPGEQEILLEALDGGCWSEIAAELGTTPAAVRRSVARLRMRLRNGRHTSPPPERGK